jgi:colanic acid biosynthesis glycosyl transferase WcaI
MTRRRLILVNRYFHPDESATSQFLTDLARHLARAGVYEVVVLASRQTLENPEANLAPDGGLDGARIHRLWSTSQGRHWLPGRLLDYLSFLASTALWLLRFARDGDTVLAKTDPPLLGVMTTLATLPRKVRRIQWLQDLYPETAVQLGVVGRHGLIAGIVRILRDWSLRHSDLVVTPSKGMLVDLREHAGQVRLEHVPNWADDFGRDEAAHLSGGLTVGYSGNLGRAHPVEGLLELAGLAIDPGLRFVITGGGANYERLRAHVQGLGRPNWSFQPYQPRAQLGALLRRPDLHLVILDPRVERLIFPSKLYGILSAGRPILHLGDTSGEVARLVKRYGCGWSLPADSGKAILDLLQQLRADPTKVEEAGRRAREAYERHHSAAAALQRWDELLAEV